MEFTGETKMEVCRVVLMGMAMGMVLGMGMGMEMEMGIKSVMTMVLNVGCKEISFGSTCSLNVLSEKVCGT